MKSIKKTVVFVALLCLISSKKAIQENNNSRPDISASLLSYSTVMSESAEVNQTPKLQPSVRIDGRFRNPWPTWKFPSIWSLAKFLFETDHSNIPSKEEELNRTLPILRPEFNWESNKASMTWIGHSTVLTHFDNITVLTDPIFSKRASITQLMGPARYRRAAVTVDELPPIDAVVISHNHYDHLDLKSVEALNDRFGERLQWFVPLGMSEWMHENGCKNVVELDWWEQSSIPNKPDIKFVLTPAQHWTKRGLNDDCKVLWGSWAIIGPNHRYFFAGDTGYCPVFKQIGEKFGPFDMSAIPIGAYEPKWMMEGQHVDPEQAVFIHKDVKSKLSVGIHWGTFALAHEYYLEPPAKLKTALREQNLGENQFITIKHGESITI